MIKLRYRQATNDDPASKQVLLAYGNAVLQYREGKASSLLTSGGVVMAPEKGWSEWKDVEISDD